VIETLADQQQWSFQKAKRIYKETAQPPFGYTPSDLDRGFVVTGLWSWSRHPNFACEQAIWVALYQWSCFATDTLYNWSGVGALGYLALFQGSTIFTESITAGKYPEYKEYQRLVAKFVPGLGAFSVSGMNSAVLGSEEKKDE
jgi:steroid 5-alpha reductase family enzyme